MKTTTQAQKLQDGQRSRALSFAWREVQEAVTDAKEGRGEVPAATQFRMKTKVTTWWSGVFLFSNLSTIGIITWYQARCLTSCCKGEWFSVRDLVRKGGSGKLKFIDGIAQYCVARIAQDLSLSSLPNQPIWMSFDGTSLFEVVLISFHYLPPWPPLLSYHPRAKELLHAILAAYCSAGAAAHAEEILFMSSEELGVEAPWSSKLTSLWTEQNVVAFNGMIWDQYSTSFSSGSTCFFVWFWPLRADGSCFWTVEIYQI